MKEKFKNRLLNTDREGIDKLLAWLETTDFYTAPASRGHHGAVEGGLLAHSMAVADRLINAAIPIEPDSAIIVGLLHDVCKVDYYTASTRNVKVDGKWTQVPYYAIDDKFPMGHGEKSLYLVSQAILLRNEEAMAIRWHMGGFDDSGRGGYSGSASLSAAMEKYPLVVATHIADLQATYFDQK